MNKRKTYIKSAAFFLVLALTIGIIYFSVFNKTVHAVSTRQLDVIGASNCTKLMIVAHPDDETLWGGAHLLEGNYLVVCITNGNNKIRRQEFADVMDATNNVGLHLSYPDKENGVRSDWNSVIGLLEDDLRLILEYKNWELVVTHNPDGEYGHIHHQMTSAVVTEIIDELTATDQFHGTYYYFGTYYKKSALREIAQTLPTVDAMQLQDTGLSSDTLLSQKMSLLSLYPSQETTVHKLEHMVPYELWVEASAWESGL